MKRKLVFAVLAIVCLAGMLFSTVQTAGVGADNPPFMVVRGTDNGIYYRIFNEATSTWGDWVQLPGGTLDSPGAAYVGDKLCVAVRGVDGMSLWQGFVNVETGAFTGWTQVSGGTTSAPELASAPSPSGLESSGYVTVNAAAFVSDSDGALIGLDLKNTGSSTAVFVGPVQLPHGATVTNVTWYWYDADPSEDIMCALRFSLPNFAYGIMADGPSSGSGGYGSTFDDTIGGAVVDNSYKTYYFAVWIPVNTPTNSLRYLHAAVGYAYLP